MTATFQSTTDTLPARFLRWCADAFAAEADYTKALGSLDEDAARRIAAEHSMPLDELVRIARLGPAAAEEMLALMQAINIDPVEAQLIHPALFADMEATCARCSGKARCRADIASGKLEKEFTRYCGNATALNTLRAEPDMLRD